MNITMQSTFLTKEDYKLEKTKEEIEREKAKKEIQKQKRERPKCDFSDLEIKPIFNKAKSNFQLKNQYAKNRSFEIADNENFEINPKSEIVRIFRESPEDPLYLDNYPYN